jgi:biotin carboxylase
MLEKIILELSYKICEKIKTTGYRGIIGIDYLYKSNGDIIFMEINPRFQSSSFLINMYLEKYYNTNLVEYHYISP